MVKHFSEKHPVYTHKSVLPPFHSSYQNPNKNEGFTHYPFNPRFTHVIPAGFSGN